MSSPMWPEVRKALDEKRYELVLVGPEVAKRVEDNGHCMDEHIYDLKILNFLEIAKTSLSSLSTKLASMENMTNLLIHSNNLTSVPEEIGQLKHLKNLNFSNNKLTEVPQSLKNCKELFTINFSGMYFMVITSYLEFHNLNTSIYFLRKSTDQAVPTCWSRKTSSTRY
jgi:Leucine-rich repeat (LRR) protein